MGRVTKKMLSPLDRAEIRKIVIVGMGMEPLEAYTKKEGETISWIQERAEDFASLDLETIGSEQFRPNVVSYLKQLQQFILGNSKAPKFPTGEEPVEEVTEVTAEPVEEAKVVEAVKEEPVKKKRGRPRKTATAKTTTSEKAEAPKVKKSGGFKVKTKKAVKAEVTPEPETPLTPKDSGLVQEEITTTPTSNVSVSLATNLETLAAFQESVDTLRAEVQALRAEQTATLNLISDALVYILNNAIIEADEDVIKDLSQLKK